MKKSLVPKSRARTAYGLLSEIRKLILAEPKRYHQGRFIERREEPDVIDPAIMPACGTVGCVAGWVATLKHGKHFNYDQTENIARGILGITGDQAEGFFDGGALHCDAHPQTKQYAKAGAAHIARFQKAHAAQLKAKAV